MTRFPSLVEQDQNFKAVISTFCSFFNDFGVHVPCQACDSFMHYNIFDSIMMITNVSWSFCLKNQKTCVRYHSKHDWYV